MPIYTVLDGRKNIMHVSGIKEIGTGIALGIPIAIVAPTIFCSGPGFVFGGWGGGALGLMLGVIISFAAVLCGGAILCSGAMRKR